MNAPAPDPGSREAAALGCLCAVLDDAHGWGAMGRKGEFWITEGCPLHGAAAKSEETTERKIDGGSAS